MKRATQFQCLVASGCIVLLAGCMVGANYHRPSPPTAPAYEEPHAPSSATGTPDIAWSDWWTVLQDPVLNNLEAQSTGANREIRIALAHVDQANAVTRSVHSYQLPTVDASPSFSRSRVAQDSPGNVTK